MSKNKLHQWTKQDPIKNFFLVPNAVFQLDLSASAKLVYAYLLYCEDRKTHQCYPSYRKIGENVGMSKKTVGKYVTELVDKRLISTENTTIITKDGRKRNGALLYTILPIQEAIEDYHRREMVRLKEETARQEAQKKLSEYDRKHPKPAA